MKIENNADVNLCLEGKHSWITKSKGVVAGYWEKIEEYSREGRLCLHVQFDLPRWSETGSTSYEDRTYQLETRRFCHFQVFC